MKDDFYIIVSSNDSKKYFPENSASNFTVHLPHEIQLQGYWRVALVELQYPQTLLHVSHKLKENWIEVSTLNIPIVQDNKSFENEIRKTTFNELHEQIYSMDIDKEKNSETNIKLTISHGNYNNLEEILKEINNSYYIKDHFKFEVISGGFVKIIKKCKENERHGIKISKYISNILGSMSEEEEIYVDNKNHYIFPYPASIKSGLPSMIYVYSNICEPYITGDAQTPLLRVFSLNKDCYNFGTNKSKEFVCLNYIPLQRPEFQTIEFNIRDQHGKNIPFEYGTLTATLHFKKFYQ